MGKMCIRDSLMAGNATILIGVDEEKVQQVIDVIRDHSFSRKQMIPTTTEMSYGSVSYTHLSGICPGIPACPYLGAGW